jgi:acetyl esterase/lipase
MGGEAFHPDLRGVARWLPRAPVGPRTLGPIRKLTTLADRRVSEGAVVEPVGPISVRVHRPAVGDGPWPALLWIHGGGYVIGSAAQDDALCRHLVQQLGMVVAAVDYRLAPEHPYPVPLHDCYDALAWLARRPDVDPGRLTVGGASAGGGLAAALALLARERGEIALALQLLAYPMLDDRTAVRTDIDERRFRLWNNRANRFGWRAYTGRDPGSAGIDGLAAPARCEDLAGLPPAWIGVGTLDLFCEEDRAYADRLTAAGVRCDLDVVPGAFHGFDSVRPAAGVSRAFRAAQVSALRGALG